MPLDGAASKYVGHEVPPDDEEFWFEPQNVTVDPTPEQQQLWKLSRQECERYYAQSFMEDDQRALRWLAKNDRYFLLTVVLRRADARRNWLFARCREVEADTDDRLDLWAREHYKSTIITFAGIIQEIIKDPEITIGIFAHNRPAAKAFLIQIKQELEDNDLLVKLFPDIFFANPKSEAPKWSEDQGIIVRRMSNPKESTVEAWGLVDGMPTGKHFRLRVYDDVVTEKSVTNPDMIKKTTEMFELSEDLGTHGGRQWMIGTRYHFGDTYGLIRQRGIVVERRYPATHDGTLEGRPIFLSERDWLRKKARSRHIVASQQLLNPLAGAETKFDARKLQKWEVRPKHLNVYIMVDPSKGKHSTSDRTAMAIIGIDANRVKYFLDGWCHRMTLSQRWQLVSRQWKRWHAMDGVQACHIGYEEFGMQTDIEYFEERMEIEKMAFPIKELKWPRQGPQSKVQRIERMEPDILMARMLMPHTFDVNEEGDVTNYDCSHVNAVQEAIAAGEKYRTAQIIKKLDEDRHPYDPMTRWLEEFSFFPFAPHDDFLDATSRIYDMDPAPPVAYTADPGHANSTEPEVYADGA